MRSWNSGMSRQSRQRHLSSLTYTLHYNAPTMIYNHRNARALETASHFTWQRCRAPSSYPRRRRPHSSSTLHHACRRRWPWGRPPAPPRARRARSRAASGRRRRSTRDQQPPRNPPVALPYTCTSACCQSRYCQNTLLYTLVVVSASELLSRTCEMSFSLRRAGDYCARPDRRYALYTASLSLPVLLIRGRSVRSLSPPILYRRPAVCMQGSFAPLCVTRAWMGERYMGKGKKGLELAADYLL